MTALGINSSYDLQDPRKFFIAYKKDSGKDFAEHLHDGLHDRGVDTFLDMYDIEEGLSRYMWRKQRDQAIIDSECFILILTHSTCSSREVKYELKIALEQDNVDIRVFVHDHIWRNDDEYLITIESRVINISDFQLGHFDTKESLLREVLNSIPIMRKFDPEEVDMIRKVIMETRIEE